MKAIVHLGMPKTGTTAIQSWLQLNRAQLKAQGIGYDRASTRTPPLRPAHSELSVVAAEYSDNFLSNRSLRIVHKVHDREAQSTFVQDYEVLFQRKIQSLEADTIILSSEYLGADLKNKKQINALHTWLSRYFDDIKYVIYFRRQEDLILSSYSQRLKAGSTKTFENFLAAAKPLKFASIARRWNAVVGSKNLDIRLFERDWLKDGDVISDFAHVIGVDHSLTDRPDDVNPSLGIAAQHLLRAINGAMPHTLNNGTKFNPAKARLRNKIIRHPDGGPRRKLTEEQALFIRKLNEDENSRLRKLFFKDRAELFPMKTDFAQPKSDETERSIAKLSADLLANNGQWFAPDSMPKVTSQPKTAKQALFQTVGQMLRRPFSKF